MVKKNACIFISGNGSNLRNLIQKSREYNFPINIKLIVSDNPNAKGIIYAKKNNIPILIKNCSYKLFEYQILVSLKKYNISLICLAGYMKIISKDFLNLYKKKIINIHPSLLPKFKGLNTYLRVLREKEKKTGCTVHHVNKHLDGGKIIIKKTFFIANEDNEKILKEKTQKLEYLAYPEAIIRIFRKY